ncbi:putative ATP-dependent helicase IRC20 [Frankliniella fusca]|uniref:ATP-dependent helicase IRC20 n=1 Tax=Frankliniella fusca TaxID=407009 RepID=A0AAE1H9N2_9NEOP|nr:putative ATP-dependent helicase IRC20 [Frankliniella fusca]
MPRPNKLRRIELEEEDSQNHDRIHEPLVSIAFIFLSSLVSDFPYIKSIVFSQLPGFSSQLQVLEDSSRESLAEEEQNVSHQSPYDEDEDSISRRVQSHQSKFCKKNELEGQSQSSLSCQPMPAPNVSVNESFYDKSTDSLLTRLEMHKADVQIQDDLSTEVDDTYSSIDTSLTGTVERHLEVCSKMFPEKDLPSFSSSIAACDLDANEDRNISASEDDLISNRVHKHLKNVTFDTSTRDELLTTVGNRLMASKECDQDHTGSQMHLIDNGRETQDKWDQHKTFTIHHHQTSEHFHFSTPKKNGDALIDFHPLLSPVCSESSNLGEMDNSSDSAESSMQSACSISFLQNLSKENENSSSSDSEEDSLTDRCFKAEEKSFVEMAKIWSTTPLFYGSHKTVNDGILSVMDLHINNLESKSGLDRMLKTISDLLPKGHLLPSSAHLILQYVEGLAPNLSVTTHYFCKNCFMYCSNDDSECPICSKHTEKGIFYCFDIEDVARSWFQERNLAAMMDKSRIGSNTESVRDIQDGSIYKALNVERGRYDVNLILATDGVRIRKNSKRELWLLMVTPVEVPIHLRQSFTTINGIWYNDEKPKNMNCFFKPFSEQMKNIHERKGIEWTHPQSKEVKKSQLKAPLVVADAPARAKVQNIMNYNSINGCNTCEISSVRSRPVPGKKAVRIYKYQHNLKLRTDEEMYRQAEEALEKGSAVMGVKGPSVLSIIPTFSVSSSCIPEYMHSILLGVTRHMVTQWVEKPGPWNINGKISEIDAALSSIQHPDFIHRTSRMLKYRKVWKASDLYYFLLFECLPILVDVLPEDYFQHLILLVFGVFTLLKRTILNQEIEESNLVLNLFVSQFERLYGDRAMTYNVHQLCHLSLCVQRFGPLHCSSAFPFEGINGMIARATHGTHHVSQEIVNNLKLYQGIQRLRLIMEGVDDSLPEPTFCMGKVLGRCKDYSLEPVEAALFETENVKIFTRAKLGFNNFTSEIHKKLKTSNQYVTWQNNGVNQYGSIRFFAMADNKFCVCVRVYKLNHLNVFYHKDTVKTISHLIPINPDSYHFVLLHEDSVLLSCEKVGRVKDFLFVRPHLLHHVL